MNTTGILGEILGAVFGLYVANNIPSWHIPIITENYLTFLPYLNVAIVGTCVVKILFHLSPWYRLQMVFEGIAQAIAIFSLYMLLQTFPFQFAPIRQVDINNLLVFALNVIIIALVIALFITIVRCIKGRPS